MTEVRRPCTCDVMPCTCGCLHQNIYNKYPSFVNEHGWIDFDKLMNYLADRNIGEYCSGPRHNMTDGEWHRVYHQKNTGALFILHANKYYADSFKPLIKWADQYNYLLKDKEIK